MAIDLTHALLDPLLGEAGIGPGQRVLDVGCGLGAVARAVARRVGPSGEVLAIDRDASLVARARATPPEPGAAPIRFEQGDLTSPPAGPFDAVTGRRVLMYVPDRAAAVRALAACLRPGGVMALQETDNTMVPFTLGSLPLHDAVYRLVWETVRREAADPGTGHALPGLLRDAGLRVEGVRAEAVVQVPERRHAVADIVRAIAARITGTGAATADELAALDLETLDDRLAAELAAANVPYIGDMLFSAWGRRT